MTLFSAEFKAEASKPNPVIFPVLEIEFPDETRRYAGAGVVSSNGFYKAKVIKGGWGSISRGTLDRTGRLESLEVSVQVDDTDFEFAMLSEGQYGGVIRRSPATIKLVSPNVTYANSYTAFTGVLASWEFTARREVKFILRTEDTPLQRFAPKVAIAQDFPNASAEALGEFAPIIYGTHDSTALGATGGAIPALYVDTVGFRYLLSQGYVKTVTRVYSGASAATGYSITYPTINGRLYTLIDFVATQGTAAITADVVGIEPVGDGSGTVISNPITQLKHFLVNFVFGDYQGGNWIADATAPINTTHFSTAAAYLDTLDVVSATRFSGAQVVGTDIVNEVCDQMNCKAFWTTEGELAILPQDLRVTDIYVSDPWFRQSAGYEISGFGIKDDPTTVIDRVSIRHCYLESLSDFALSLEVRDTASDEEATDSLDMRWSPASLV